MIIDFINNLNPALSAILIMIPVSLVSGFLGSLVIWNRMSQAGDSISHSALLGVALSIVFGLNLNLGIFIACIIFTAVAWFFTRQNFITKDTTMAILAYSFLSIGLLIMSLSGNEHLHLENYLFGEILEINTQGIFWVYISSFIILMTTLKFWRPFIITALNPNIARSLNIKTGLLEPLLILAITLQVTMSVQVVGVLLTASMLVIPTASSNLFSRTPLQSALSAGLLALAASVMGILPSVYYNLPIGPMIVVAEFALLCLALISKMLLAKNLGQKSSLE